MDLDKVQKISDKVISLLEEELPPFATAHQLAKHIHAMELKAEVFVPREGYVAKPEIWVFSEGKKSDTRLIERIQTRLGKNFTVRDCGDGRHQISNARVSHFLNFFENDKIIQKEKLWQLI